jgi:DNA primase large subunit
VDWKKIKAEYIAGGTSYRKLCDKYDVPLSTLKRVAHDEDWVGLREQCKTKSATKIIEIESDKQAERMKRLLSVSDKLLLAVEDAVNKFQAEELLLDRTALKSLSGTIKDIKDIQSLKTSLDIEEQKARIAILKKQAEADTNGSTEVSITFGVDEEQNQWAE